MKLLLDECLPKRLKRLIEGYELSTVQEMGWSSKKNGELLKLMTGQFDVLITVDANLVKQQNLAKAGVACVILRAKSNRLADLEGLIPQVSRALHTIQAGDWVEIS